MDRPPAIYGIVGLGNPGKAYRNTRHNVGFRIIEILAERHNIKLKRKWRLKARVGRGQIEGRDLVLVQPVAFMNLSGAAVRPVLDYYRIPLNGLLVILDDVNLELERIRLRGKGSHGGHKGLESIIAALGSDDFCRLRLGIGPGPSSSMKRYVLGVFTPNEREVVELVLEQAAEAVEMLLREGMAAAMNKYNTKQEN